MTTRDYGMFWTLKRALAMCLLAALAVIFAVFAPRGALAAGPTPRPGHSVLERADLIAGAEVHRWESAPFVGTVYVNIRMPGGALLPQTALSRDGCGGAYSGHGVIVRVRLLRCQSPDANPIRTTFVSLGRPRHIRVIISDFPLGR
jgi:hypothetical protein